MTVSVLVQIRSERQNHKPEQLRKQKRRNATAKSRALGLEKSHRLNSNGLTCKRTLKNLLTPGQGINWRLADFFQTVT
jgi:hypothetical protein